MATPPLSEELAREAWETWNACGRNTSAAAAKLDIPRSTLQHRIAKYREYQAASPGQLEAVQTAGLDIGQAKHGWRVIQHEDGSRDSVFWKAPELPDDTLERIRQAFEGMAPAEPVMPPERTEKRLMTVYPVFDLHFGMRAWGRETGGPDYDIENAAGDLCYAFEKVLSITPGSDRAVLILGGDTLHADDTQSRTPESGHALDVDGRHFKVLREAIRVIAYIIDRVLSKHGSLTVRVLRGNHDKHSHMVLTFALAERYRRDGRVTVDQDPRELFMARHGACAIFAHHGDRIKPERLTLYASDVCPWWSETRHRYALTGHIHHDSAKDFGALRWESLRAFCPPDSYAASMGYSARRALQALTFDEEDGLVLRALDPIERPTDYAAPRIVP